MFTDIAAHRDFNANLAYGTRARAGSGMLVSDGYFAVLGLKPELGRLIGSQDTLKIGEAAVAVLSYDYWNSDFGADPFGHRAHADGEWTPADGDRRRTARLQ